MEPRYKKLANQLGHKIIDPGAHMPHAAVALIQRRNSKKKGFNEKLEIKGNRKGSLLEKYNPFPLDFIPGSM